MILLSVKCSPNLATQGPAKFLNPNICGELSARFLKYLNNLYCQENEQLHVVLQGGILDNSNCVGAVNSL